MSSSTEDTFDFHAYLQSDELADWREYRKVEGIIRSVSASVSAIGSAAIIWHILRSHKGLSSTYHRLVFGLCVGDLMSSVAYALNSTAAPKEMQYIMPSALGSMGTCIAQGLLLTFGITIASLYNWMICFYYLSIITYNKKDEYIKGKLELWFHVVPIAYAIVTGMIGLMMKQYNTNGFGGNCHLTSYHPPHCQGIVNGIIPEGFTVPCGRGGTKVGHLYRLVMYLIPVTVTPAIIVGTMATMYRTVRKVERKMLNYGASALRLRASQRQARVVGDPNTARGRDNNTCISIVLDTLKSSLVSICPYLFRRDDASWSNNARSKKRSVLYMAMNYSLTWVLTWIPFYILFFVINNNTTTIMQASLQPLQGLYNLIVYMSPKVRTARNTKRGKLPWRQAIFKAWKSKGEEDRAIFGRRNAIAALTMRQRLQFRLSRFMDRRKRRRSPTSLTSSQATVSGSAMIPPMTSVKQNKRMNIDRKDDNEWKKDREAHEGINNTIAPPSIYQNERKNHESNMNSNRGSKSKDHKGTKRAKMKSTSNRINYVRNNSSSTSDRDIDVIDVSRDVPTRHPMIKSKQSQQCESGKDTTVGKVDNDICGDRNKIRINDARENSNLLSYHSSRNSSSELDDDLSEDVQ